jgi:LAO/AO transport system kinase
MKPGAQQKSSEAAKGRIRKHRLAIPSPTEMAEMLHAENRAALSEAITMSESLLPEDVRWTNDLLDLLVHKSNNTIRIGITGVPGVGKSTFIESFGLHLIAQGLKVAVLAIDPSSERSGGSILGDKTRMYKLAQEENAFIRPSPAREALGGVARRTREVITLCEAGGYDVIIIETVGVGQSETTVRHMVDFFLLLMLSGAGDELQGIKRGIMEMADAVVITKADGDNQLASKRAAGEYKAALHLFPPAANKWTPQVSTCSALQNEGISEVWDLIQSFKKQLSEVGWLAQQRSRQDVHWFKESVHEQVLEHFYKNPEKAMLVKSLQDQVEEGKISPFRAARKLFE